MKYERRRKGRHRVLKTRKKKNGRHFEQKHIERWEDAYDLKVHVAKRKQNTLGKWGEVLLAGGHLTGEPTGRKRRRGLRKKKKNKQGESKFRSASSEERKTEGKKVSKRKISSGGCQGKR